MFPRTCFCGVIGILPTACNHITCHNCKLESCFLCEAAHLSVVSHGNHYHHDKCHFYKDCCDEKCLQMNKQHCKHDKYKPGPCQPCRDAKHHNACTHSNWKPCNKCLLQKLDCRHDWCPQCTALGSLCSPILPNHDTVKIFDYNQVEQKKKEM